MLTRSQDQSQTSLNLNQRSCSSISQPWQRLVFFFHVLLYIMISLKQECDKTYLYMSWDVQQVNRMSFTHRYCSLRLVWKASFDTYVSLLLVTVLTQKQTRQQSLVTLSTNSTIINDSCHTNNSKHMNSGSWSSLNNVWENICGLVSNKWEVYAPVKTLTATQND